jgi:hypothetical protein
VPETHARRYENPFDISGVTLDLSDNAALAVDVVLAPSEPESTTESFEVAHDELSTGANFTVSLSSANFEITLRVLRRQPKVVFEFAPPLSATQRARSSAACRKPRALLSH